jgi:hypothetical protein
MDRGEPPHFQHPMLWRLRPDGRREARRPAPGSALPGSRALTSKSVKDVAYTFAVGFDRGLWAGDGKAQCNQCRLEDGYPRAPVFPTQTHKPEILRQGVAGLRGS